MTSSAMAIDAQATNFFMRSPSEKKQKQKSGRMLLASSGRNVAGIAQSVYKIGNVQRVCGRETLERVATYDDLLFSRIHKI
jgi:hypothetical protein